MGDRRVKQKGRLMRQDKAKDRCRDKGRGRAEKNHRVIAVEGLKREEDH